MSYINVPDNVQKYMEFMEYCKNEDHSVEYRMQLNKILNDYKESHPNVVTIYNAYKYWYGYVCPKPRIDSRNPERGPVGVKAHSKITDLFTGLYYSSVICEVCKTVTDTFEPFTIVSLPIKERGVTTLEDALSEFTKEELLTGDNKFYCSKCKCNVDARKKMYIWEPPKVLIIQLKKFKNTTRNIAKTYTINSTSKIHTKVAFPFENLDIAPQLSELHPIKSTKYNLCATSHHNSKTHNMGHCVAYCKNSLNYQWYKYDDDDVYYIPPEKVKDDVMSEDAYILFYVVQ
jgi:ubiquitin carboxyl-terminal hydrolase 8